MMIVIGRSLYKFDSLVVYVSFGYNIQVNTQTFFRRYEISLKYRLSSAHIVESVI